MPPKSKKKSSSQRRMILLAVLAVIPIGLVAVDMILSGRLVQQEAALVAAGVPRTTEDLGLTPVAPEGEGTTKATHAVVGGTMTRTC